MTSPLRDRSVRAVLVAQFFSAAAVFALGTALGKQVYDISGRALDLGLLGLLEFLPAALLVLVTGAIADRYDRRKIAALAFAGEAVCALALALLAANGVDTVTPIFIAVFMFGIARAFAAPAGRSLPANVAPPGTLPKVAATNSVMWQSALIIGPVLGGVLYAISPRAPYLVSALFIMVAAASVLSIRFRPEVAEAAASRAADRGASGSSDGLDDASSAAGAEGRRRTAGLSGAMDGLKFIRRTPILLGAISLDLFAVLFGGAVALLPAIADERLGVGAVGLGVLRAAGGIGATIMAIVLARKPVVHRVGRTLLISVAVFGLATIALGLTTLFIVAFLAIATLSAADMISVYIRATLVPLATPDDVRGRVMAAENVFIGASNELGAFESGVAGQLIGTTGAVVSGGILTLVVAAAYWFSFRPLRDLDSFDELHPTPAAEAFVAEEGDGARSFGEAPSRPSGLD